MTTTARVFKLPACNFDCPVEASYDFRTMGGSWAYACEEHYRKYRMYSTLGLGKGQQLIVEGGE